MKYVFQDVPVPVIEGLRRHVQVWLKDHSIKAFYAVTQAKSFEDGAINCLNLTGLGKLSPNMLLMGFKSNWAEDLSGTEQYLNVIHHGLDLHLAIGILRIKGGCDFSSVISEEIVDKAKDEVTNGGDKEEDMAPGVVSNKKGKKKAKDQTPVYHGTDGRPLPKATVDRIVQFQVNENGPTSFSTP